MEAGEFNSPAGLWIDGRNRLYVADTNNGRVQVFQLRDDIGAARNAGLSPSE
jgi:sugar lactone lactonase YvrE